jgi:hypothetical protein
MSPDFPTFKASIYLSGDTVIYTLDGREIRFPVSSIQLIGEFSAPPGALIADYFFSFKIRESKSMIDVPGFTTGLFETLSALRKILPFLAQPKLQMHSGFHSNILFPEEFAGTWYYEFHAESKPLINLPLLRNIGSVHSVVKNLNKEVVMLN